MSQFDFHKSNKRFKPHTHTHRERERETLPIIQKLVDAYKLWQEFIRRFPKTSRYTLGEKIDSLFLETIELLFTASILYRGQKIPYIRRALIKLDMLKFFLQVAWGIKTLDNKQFISLSEKLEEIGKMAGGWYRQLSRENPAATDGEK